MKCVDKFVMVNWNNHSEHKVATFNLNYIMQFT